MNKKSEPAPAEKNESKRNKKPVIGGQANIIRESEEIILKLNTQNEELINDLQRLRADIENYRKRSEIDKASARDFSRQQTVTKLLPVIDNITRATAHLPEDLQTNDWAAGVMKLPQLLEKDLKAIGVTRILAEPRTVFNPEIHEAIQMDEESEGETEVVAEELQTGYMVDGVVLRPAMVRVTRK